MSNSRGRPHSYTGINGSISAHCSSVRSLAYPSALDDTCPHSCLVRLNCSQLSVYQPGVFSSLFIKWLLRAYIGNTRYLSSKSWIKTEEYFGLKRKAVFHGLLYMKMNFPVCPFRTYGPTFAPF